MAWSPYLFPPVQSCQVESLLLFSLSFNRADMSLLMKSKKELPRVEGPPTEEYWSTLELPLFFQTEFPFSLTLSLSLSLSLSLCVYMDAHVYTLTHTHKTLTFYIYLA